MASEDVSWSIRGVAWEDPKCLHTVEEAVSLINERGFLPLFHNHISGFSLEEYTATECWWCDNPEVDPWIWRERIARDGRVVYGKFFDGKAGFISKEWLPQFVNYRRDGYDFDALWDDEKASRRQKKIMDLFALDHAEDELYSFEIKKQAGFEKNSAGGGEKNFEGTITELQMQMYLCMRDFRRKKNKKGREYGWNVAVYSTLEHLYGYDFVTSAYGEKPSESGESIYAHVRKLYPAAEEKQIKKLLR